MLILIIDLLKRIERIRILYLIVLIQVFFLFVCYLLSSFYLYRWKCKTQLRVTSCLQTNFIYFFYCKTIRSVLGITILTINLTIQSDSEGSKFINLLCVDRHCIIDFNTHFFHSFTSSPDD